MVDETRSGPPKNNKETTRLIRNIQTLLRKLSSRINELRRGISVKVLFFLLGFYCATAFATVIGQTGDWDILSAGLAVVVVEAIGAVMYSASSRFFDKMRDLITMFNYWKAGLTLGLFLDSFKYEMDTLLEKFNPFYIDMDFFHTLL
ncbi:Ycf20-like protein [Dendrobium catenatum]|uniref:Ycf20-like protein n=2 Tax=Dendrobium catenatum TaxID=906689 RepID=A0A2I0VK92_9ASPA|nr:Ycf20-like protein [Dendrobium catenatum]